MGPHGSRHFKTLLLPQISFESFQIFSKFFLSGPHKSTVLDFLNFEFPILTNFLNSPLYPIGKQKTSIIWKTGDCRAKRSENWASGVSIQCTHGTFDTSVIKVILGSFGAFRFSTSLYLENG